jgi:hypothetical protein
MYVSEGFQLIKRNYSIKSDTGTVTTLFKQYASRPSRGSSALGLASR